MVCADFPALASYNQVDIERSPWISNTRRAKLPSLSVWRLLTWQAPQGLIAFVVMAAILAAMVGGYVRSLPTLRIAVDGQLREVRTNQTTVASVLRDAGVTLYPQDRVVPPLDATIEEGEAIRVDHARPVVVEVDGQTIRTRSLRSAPADILADLGFALSPYDKLVVDGQLVANDSFPRIRAIGDGVAFKSRRTRCKFSRAAQHPRAASRHVDRAPDGRSTGHAAYDHAHRGRSLARRWVHLVPGR